MKFSAPTTLLEDSTTRLDEVRWEFDGQRGSMWRVRMDRPSDARILTADQLTRVEDMAPRGDEPSATINGGFYHEWVWGYEPSGLVVADGTESSKLTEVGGSGVFFDDGKHLDIVHRDEFEPTDDVTDALQSVDRIIHGSKSLVSQKPDRQRASRSAIALTDDAVWLVLLAGDGSVRRHADAIQLDKTSRYGVPLWAFTTLLVENIGPKRALNLDGSVSTQLLVRLEGQTFSVRGDRGVLNAIYLTPGRS